MEYTISYITIIFQTSSITRSTDYQVCQKISSSLFDHLHSNSITHADLLIVKYLLISHHISSNQSSAHIIDDLFKASSKELPYVFRAIGVLLHQNQVWKDLPRKQNEEYLFIDE